MHLLGGLICLIQTLFRGKPYFLSPGVLLLFIIVIDFLEYLFGIYFHSVEYFIYLISIMNEWKWINPVVTGEIPNLVFRIQILFLQFLASFSLRLLKSLQIFFKNSRMNKIDTA